MKESLLALKVYISGQGSQFDLVADICQSPFKWIINKMRTRYTNVCMIFSRWLNFFIKKLKTMRKTKKRGFTLPKKRHAKINYLKIKS